MERSLRNQVFPYKDCWRVKKFVLDKNKAWIDRGTGNAQIIKTVNPVVMYRIRQQHLV